MKITIEYRGKIIKIDPGDESTGRWWGTELERVLTGVISDCGVEVEDHASWYRVQERISRPDKIQAIKEVRDLYNLGLKEAKDIVDGERHILLRPEQATVLRRKLDGRGFDLARDAIAPESSNNLTNT